MKARSRRRDARTRMPGDALGTPDVAGEVALRELGEAVANAVARAHEELARYPNTLGAYILDEVEVSLPIVARIDDLGQTMVKVTEREKPEAGAAQLRIRIKPIVGATPASPFSSSAPLAVLKVFNAAQLEQLHKRRVFSVIDLQHLLRNGGGRAALADVLPGIQMADVEERVTLASLPTVPQKVVVAMLDMGVARTRHFLEADAEKLAGTLSEKLRQPIRPEHVMVWQADTRRYVGVPVPATEATKVTRFGDQ